MNSPTAEEAARVVASMEISFGSVGARVRAEPNEESSSDDISKKTTALPYDGPKKDLSVIIANYPMPTPTSAELSIIAQPISAGRPHTNDSVISIEDDISSPAEEGNLTRTAVGETRTTNNVGGDESQLNGQQPAPTSANGLHQNGSDPGGGGGQWMMSMAAQTTQEMRQRVSMASDQLGLSLRHLYASATTGVVAGVDVPPSYHNIPGIVPYYRGRSSGPPPSYDDVINPYAPPPTYQSLFGQMREASKNSRSFMDLLKRLVILSTIGCSLLLAFVVLVPFSMIAVGAIYLDDCRIEHIPAFLLVGGLVWASKNILHCCVQCQDAAMASSDDELPDYGYYEEQHHHHHRRRGSDGDAGTSDNTMGHLHHQVEQAATNAPTPPTRPHNSRRRYMKSSICESLLNCILFGWFVAGCVIVFRNHNPDFEDENSPKFCNRTVYMYTFWLITSGLVVFSLFVSCICCLMISSAIATRQDDDLS